MSSLAKARTYAIGDVHGCHAEIVRLIDAIDPQPIDTIILLGDYVDRGADSKAVIATIIKLKERCNVIALMGNHEAMMYKALTEEDGYQRFSNIRHWLQNGGGKTAESYYLDVGALLACEELEDLMLPDDLANHLAFLESLPLYYITDTHIFVHASPKLDIAIEDQKPLTLIWRRANESDAQVGYEHISGKTIVCGHTMQISSLPCKLSDKNIIIDTACFASGWLTAMNVDDGSYIQASVTEVRGVSSELEVYLI
jgi:serine/threonine protein phosphatase 1